ncbi:hypothetical protein BSKO_10113 [Bryopsis sp. KO-2023]|nr:hypothetical protein BSKO_10113 [Bryopsis sp. KO-2023]
MWRFCSAVVVPCRQLSFLLVVVTSSVAARTLHQDPSPEIPEEKREDDDGVPLWLYFLIPIISGLVGYGTNVVALKMTFHPVEFVGWKLWQPKGQPFGLFGWQGIVPAKSSVMAGRLVDLFTEKLIDVPEVFGRVDPEAVKQCCKEGTKAITRRSVEEIVKSIIPAVWQALPQYVKDEVLLVVEKESAHFTLLLMERVKNRILEVLDLKGLVQRWAEENKRVFVEVFLEIGQTEYRFVEWSGWWFGLLFGGIQALIYRFYGEWWVLPVAGLLVGYLTNLAAIKLIFEPAEPKKILGCFTIQGVFLKRQHEAAAMIAELSEREFMRVDLFFDEIINGKNKHMFHAMLQEVTEEYLDGVSTTAEKIAAPLILGDNAAQRVREIVVKTVMQEIGNVFPAAYGIMERQMDLANTLKTKMRALKPSEFIGVLRPVFQEDEFKLMLVGGFLGAIVGLVQHFAIFQWFD